MGDEDCNSTIDELEAAFKAIHLRLKTGDPSEQAALLGEAADICNRMLVLVAERRHNRFHYPGDTSPKVE